MSRKLNVEGIAVTSGVSRNKISYLAEELSKFAPTLKGRPILKDHENLSDSAIGKVTSTEILDNGNKIKFKGWIKDESIIDKVKEGIIENVSIGAIVGKLVKEKEKDNILIAKDMEALELSVTPVPGIPGASIRPDKESFTEEEVSQWIKDYNEESYSTEESKDLEEDTNNKLNKNKENKNMATLKPEVEEKVQEEVKEVTPQVDWQAKFDEMKATHEAFVLEQAKKDYLAVCEAKKMKAVKLEGKTLEAIKALTEMAEEQEEPKEEAKPEVEPEKEEPKEEPKEVAEPKSEEPKAKEDSAEEKFKDLVIETSDFGGFAMWRNY